MSCFIRYVDEVSELSGTYIYVRDNKSGIVEICEGPLEEGTGFAFFYSSTGREFCDIILPKDPIAVYPEGQALAIILHELAHAHDYYIRRRNICNDNLVEAEINFWKKAVEWVSMAPLPFSFVFDITYFAQIAIR